MVARTPRVAAALVAAGALMMLTGCGAVGAAGNASTSPAASATTDWSVQAVSETADGKTTSFTYKPIDRDKVAKDLTICVLFPNMSDDYWAAVDYGSLQEAKRDGVTFAAYQAGGYTNLQTQLDQLDGCITQKVSAIVIGAISNGACSGVEKAIAAGIPVVDYINGMTCPKVEGNSLFAHVYIGGADLGNAAAEMLLAEKKAMKIGLFPGPDGAAFADIQAKAIQDKLDGTDVKVQAVRRGDLSEDGQLTLVEDVLRTYPDVDAVMGITAAGSAGITAIRNNNLQDKVAAYQYAITPSFYQAIVSGTGKGSVSDLAPVTARMGIDQAVRLASKIDPTPGPRIGPEPKLVTKKTLADIDYSEMFAPKGFQLTYNWSPSK